MTFGEVVAAASVVIELLTVPVYKKGKTSNRRTLQLSSTYIVLSNFFKMLSPYVNEILGDH